jgi:hypothetical protein
MLCSPWQAAWMATSCSTCRQAQGPPTECYFTYGQEDLAWPQAEHTAWHCVAQAASTSWRLAALMQLLG